MQKETRIKVLFIHQDGLITGSAISLFSLLSGLKKNCVDPIIVLAKDGPAKAYFESLNIPVHVVLMHGFWTTPGPRWYQRGSLQNYKALRKNTRLYQFVTELKPDLIHINDKAALNAGLTLHGLNIPIIQHLRSSYHTCNFFLFKLLSRKIIQRYATHLIGISEDEIDGFEKAKNLSIIYNTVDFHAADIAMQSKAIVRQSLNIAETDLVIGYVGIFSRIRGAWDFMKICATLKKRNPDLPLKFLMVGNVPAVKTLNYGLFSRFKKQESPVDLYHELKDNLHDQLVTPGYTKEPLRFMAAMDILVVTSHLGVMGRQPLEAQSVGVPIVGYDGQSRKTTVLLRGTTGVLMPCCDQQKLSEKLEILLKDNLCRKEMAEKSLIYSRENFDPDRNAEKVIRIYKMLLNNKKSY